MPSKTEATGHLPTCAPLTLRNLTALQVLLKDSTDVCSLCLLAPSNSSDARALSDSGHPALGRFPLAANETFPAGVRPSTLWL